MGRELGDAGPATVGFFSGSFSGAPTPGFSTPASPTEVDHGLLRIPGACYVAVNDLEKQRPEGVDDNGDLVLRYLHKGHN